MDSAENDAVCACSVVQSELKELLTLLYCLAGLDLDGSEVGLAEGVEVDLVLEERLDLDV